MRRPEYMEAVPALLPDGSVAFGLAQKCRACGAYDDGALMPDACPSCGQVWRIWQDSRPLTQRGDR
jgi:rubrerythrin